MQKGLLAGSSPFTQLIMLAFTMIACFLLFMFIGLLLTPLVPGIPYTELMDIFSSGRLIQHPGLMRYMQVLQGIGLFIVPAFFAAFLFSGTVFDYLELKQNTSAKWFGAVLLLMLAAMPCINLLAALNEMIVFPESLSGLEQRLKDSEEAARQLTELFMNVDNVGGMLFNIFMIAILPALGEELIFRGLLQKIFTKWTGNVHIAIIVTGFLFSLMHMQFYGFFPRWLLGVMFGYLLVWSGTIWLPVFAHFVNNSAAVFLSFLIHKGVISDKIEVFGSAWHDVPVTIAATIFCGWLLWKIYKNRNS
jgi:membrane protease YdiL (CAAX protease family)